jgi:recombination protein RecT
MNENALAIVCKSLVDPKMQDQFKAVLPQDIALDRFTRVTLTAIQQDPSILECDRQSLYNACVDAAKRGLLPDKKEGALVSFNTKQGDTWIKKAQFMPMPEGIIKEMAKAGIKAYAVSVYENEQVDIWNDDDGQHFKHKPIAFGDRGKRMGAVACAKDSEGRTFVEAMNMDDLSRAAAASKSKDKQGNPVGPWKDWPERMEQKTVLHRLRKRVAILGNDDVVERLRQDEEDLTPPVIEYNQDTTPPAKRPSTLQAVLDDGVIDDTF